MLYEYLNALRHKASADFNLEHLIQTQMLLMLELLLEQLLLELLLLLLRLHVFNPVLLHGREAPLRSL